MKKPKICVVGSSNYDLIAYTNRIPKQGESILGYDFKMGCGGKGANQAASAAKLGADVSIITKLGQDIFGTETLENYKKLNINTEFISITDRAPSGVAPIWVEKGGYNSIIVVPGANNLMTLDELDAAKQVISSADVLLCQNEIPIEITQKALEIAKSAGVLTIFNPAPAPLQDLPSAFWRLIDIICPNETEAEILTQSQVTNIEEAQHAAGILHQKGVETVLITLGANGCLVTTAQKFEHIQSRKVNAIDTTGAGDCFLGSFAYFYAKGLSLADAVERAQYVASYSVQRHGTQSSYPNAAALPHSLFDENLKFNYKE